MAKAVAKLRLAAHAKINLALDVLGKRLDGFHEVAMIMQAIGLHDTVDLAWQDGEISLVCDRDELSCDHSNLAFRAADLLRRECGVKQGVHISLTKRIPMAAGLAGGSSDAAAVLKGLNVLWQLDLTPQELEGLAARLGSDVPFCLWGGTAFAAGRGEILTPLADFAGHGVVLANPPLQVSTAWVYQNYRPEAVISHPDINRMRDSIQRGDFAAVADGLGNMLETVTVPEHPQIAEIKAAFTHAGASAVLMSGSGPTVFALTPDRASAVQLASRVSLAAGVAVFVTETVAREDQIHVPSIVTG